MKNRKNRLSRSREVRLFSIIRRDRSPVCSIRPDREIGNQWNLGTESGRIRSSTGMRQDSTPQRKREIAVGRLAPSPTGGLHLGHARSFLIAWLAARHGDGRVILRIEDLDTSRVRAEARLSTLLDLRWLGLDWDEGPDVGGPSAPYVQSERLSLYETALDRLKASESVYPCTCTRADIQRAASAPALRGGGAELSGDLREPICRRCRPSGRSPICLAVPRAPAVDRLG